MPRSAISATSPTPARSASACRSRSTSAPKQPSTSGTISPAGTQAIPVRTYSIPPAGPLRHSCSKPANKRSRSACAGSLERGARERYRATSMAFPADRPRRLRRTDTLRKLVRETELSPSDFMLPLFAVSGRGVRKPIASMPGVAQLSVDNLVEEARTADNVAPSDMMDGRVAAIRNGLDENGLSDTPIMSYAVKYASGFYGPFREAAQSAPKQGDRRGYQMDPANVREARREALLDVGEGADIVMVKPALAYLDVIAEVKRTTNLPVAAYNVSGEYSMLKAAAQAGWIDEKRVCLEILTGIKRAGADIILTYSAAEAARSLQD